MSISRCSAFLFLILLVAGALVLVSGCLTEQPADGVPPTETISNLTFYTEQNPPYNYEENGTLRGISIDLLEAVTEKMGHNVSRSQVRLVPWDEAYQAALTGNNTMIFAIARIPTRESSFKWAGPVPPYTTVVFARPDSGIVINNPTDLQAYRIGVVAEDAAMQQLLDIGVNESRIVQEPEASILIERTLNGTIDLWADSEISGRIITREVTGSASTFQVVYAFPEIPIYYGFSKDVRNTTVQSFQQALDTLKTEKDATGMTTYDRIVQRYIHPVAPEMTTDDLALFVQNASAFAATVGKQAALAEFSKKDGQFSRGDVYIYAYDYNCTLLAHPYQAELVGTDRTNYTDIRGLPMIQVGNYAASNGGGFIAYLYPAPDSGVIDEKALDSYEPKIGYIAPVGDSWWIGSGIYFSGTVPGSSGRPEVVSRMTGLVEQAAAYGRDHGSSTAFTEISNRKGMFVDAEGHYIYAYDYNGTLLAHPYLPEKIGTNLITKRDPFGMENIRALATTAQSGGGYVIFIWPNPDRDNQDELKIGYVLPVDDSWWVGSGVYLSEITGTNASLPSPVP